jgi:hypothetical protein
LNISGQLKYFIQGVVVMSGKIIINAYLNSLILSTKRLILDGRLLNISTPKQLIPFGIIIIYFFVMYVPLSVFYVLFVCKCVTDCCHRVSNKLQFKKCMYIVEIRWKLHTFYVTISWMFRFYHTKLKWRQKWKCL